ncbi:MULTISPECIES: alpha/beta hydrolase [unclassified Sphingobacterium]|uniref:alpha/beta hydrolase n=1 Tax=unclassified Sphingobacterium TaxID=2609468 RepID=UPI0025F9215F|nr:MULTISPECIES: prolyl oligopeptidase family serine peptidase [unclassified Sphingobacterium]
MKFIFFICSLLMSQAAFGQKTSVINNESTVFTLETPNSKIDFLVIDPAPKSKKPLFLFCQGSLPIPLYFNYKKEGLSLFGGGLTNFNYQDIIKSYHLVVISMPETPVIVDESQLNDSYWYYGDSKDKNIPSRAYQEADYLYNYVNRAVSVLDYLSKQPWVDNSQLTIFGHSQGGHVAAKLANKYKKVSKLGLSGTNLFGRIDQDIRQAKRDVQNGKITWQQASQKIEQTYAFYKDANTPEKLKNNPNLRSWKSFSQPAIDELLGFEYPIYLVFGTEDIVAELNDLVPLYFIRNHKNNLTIKRYYNLEHNYFEVQNDGRPDYKKPHWDDIMTDFLTWTLEQKTTVNSN